VIAGRPQQTDKAVFVFCDVVNLLPYIRLGFINAALIISVIRTHQLHKPAYTLGCLVAACPQSLCCLSMLCLLYWLVLQLSCRTSSSAALYLRDFHVSHWLFLHFQHPMQRFSFQNRWRRGPEGQPADSGSSVKQPFNGSIVAAAAVSVYIKQ